MTESIYGFEKHPWVSQEHNSHNKILTFVSNEWFEKKENGNYKSLGFDWGNGPEVDQEKMTIDIHNCGDYSDVCFDYWMGYISVFITYWNNNGYRIHTFKSLVGELCASDPLGRADNYRYIKEHKVVFVLEKY